MKFARFFPADGGANVLILSPSQPRAQAAIDCEAFAKLHGYTGYAVYRGQPYDNAKLVAGPFKLKLESKK